MSNTAFLKHRAKKQQKNRSEAKKFKQLVINFYSLLTGLCLTAGFLSAGFLAASDNLFTVKGTPYLAAGLVIFWAGASGMDPAAERLAAHTSEKNSRDCVTMLTNNNNNFICVPNS